MRHLIGRCVSAVDTEWLNSWSAVSATPENMDKCNRCRSFRHQYSITIYMTALSDCPFRCRSFRALFNCMIVSNIWVEEFFASAHQAKASSSLCSSARQSRCTALQAVVGICAISPAHPSFTRMYGVTHSTVFQTVSDKRNLNNYLFKRPQIKQIKAIFSLSFVIKICVILKICG